MQLFLFQSQRDTGVKALTRQKDGRNLPPDFQPPQYLDEIDVMPDTKIMGVSDGCNAVLAGIQRDGFFLVRPNITVPRSNYP
jgi:hypothetical protein